MRFIDEHKERFNGVEPICRVLTEHGCQIAPSTYWAAKKRPASPRAVRDAELAGHIARVHAANYGVYGARKVWHELNRKGHRVARCTVERLMREAGLAGVVRGKKVRTTVADPGQERAGDRLDRNRPAVEERLTTAGRLLAKDGTVATSSPAVGSTPVTSRAVPGLIGVAPIVILEDQHQRGEPRGGRRSRAASTPAGHGRDHTEVHAPRPASSCGWLPTPAPRR